MEANRKLMLIFTVTHDVITSSAFQASSGQSFFIFCFTDFFHYKLESEDEIKIKIKFIRTIFQLN